MLELRNERTIWTRDDGRSLVTGELWQKLLNDREELLNRKYYAIMFENGTQIFSPSIDGAMAHLDDALPEEATQ